MQNGELTKIANVIYKTAYDQEKHRIKKPQILVLKFQKKDLTRIIFCGILDFERSLLPSQSGQLSGE